MKKITEKRNGFSYIELMVVISILGIVIAVLGLNLNEARIRALMESTQSSMVSAFEQAQNRSVTGVGSQKHGVRVESDKIIIFNGDNYDENAKDLEEISLGSFFTDQDVTIIFDRISGRPDKEAVINIFHNNGLTESVIVTESGVISNY